MTSQVLQQMDARLEGTRIPCQAYDWRTDSARSAPLLSNFARKEVRVASRHKQGKACGKCLCQVACLFIFQGASNCGQGGNDLTLSF